MNIVRPTNRPSNQRRRGLWGLLAGRCVFKNGHAHTLVIPFKATPVGGHIVYLANLKCYFRLSLKNSNMSVELDQTTPMPRLIRAKLAILQSARGWSVHLFVLDFYAAPTFYLERVAWIGLDCWASRSRIRGRWMLKGLTRCRHAYLCRLFRW